MPCLLHPHHVCSEIGKITALRRYDHSTQDFLGSGRRLLIPYIDRKKYRIFCIYQDTSKLLLQKNVDNHFVDLVYVQVQHFLHFFPSFDSSTPQRQGPKWLQLPGRLNEHLVFENILSVFQTIQVSNLRKIHLLATLNFGTVFAMVAIRACCITTCEVTSNLDIYTICIVIEPAS
jgi:hypothetical protein